MNKFSAWLLAWLLLAAVISGCSSDDQSPEDAVRAFVASAENAAERRSADELLEMIDENYLDKKGQNRKQVAGLLRAYFFTHKNIHLFTRIERIEWLGETQATVTLHVAMAGSVISDIEALELLRARIYRFELGLVRQDQDRWLLQHADWKAANLLDMR